MLETRVPVLFATATVAAFWSPVGISPKLFILLFYEVKERQKNEKITLKETWKKSIISSRKTVFWDANLENLVLT